MQVELNYVIETETPDDGDVAHVSNEVSADSEDEPYGDLDEVTYDFSGLLNEANHVIRTHDSLCFSHADFFGHYSGTMTQNHRFGAQSQNCDRRG